MNAKDEILKILNGEEILAISIGAKGHIDDPPSPFFYDGENIKTALEILDYEFNEGHGAEEGYDVYVWTEHKVIFKHVYEGSEKYVWVPRNPSRIIPLPLGC
ncbi:MAG: hypothetical protein SVM80_13775 [Halobacteriota archaeon]|nr:hypothetical protein [Halobacteriota archaeon]